MAVQHQVDGGIIAVFTSTLATTVEDYNGLCGYLGGTVHHSSKWRFVQQIVKSSSLDTNNSSRCVAN